jgi:putative ABC transport system permease protein
LTRFADALRDRYVLGRELGRGGMATVYAAHDVRHNRQVAVKVLHQGLATALGPERFEREIELAAQLQHPHILPVHDSGAAAGFLCTSGDPDRMSDALRAAVWSVDRDQPVWKVRSMASLLDRDLAPRRFTARLAGGFAVVAMLLALIGVYGVMSYMVAQRTREIGIRMALGAARSEVVRLVLARGLRVIAAGTALGLAGALGGARLIAGQLYGVPPTDLATFVAVPAALMTVAALACWVPARRAARVDPAVALSAE